MSAMGLSHINYQSSMSIPRFGGKLVFQRWTDKQANKDFMKVEYVYQTAD
ncbi:hypothetical protein [Providencia hangzhouensis]